jgi:D-alanine--poly(phosphoribitol) ligase subunit 1
VWLLDELENLKNSGETAIINKNKSRNFKELWEYSEKIACFINKTCKTKNPIVIYGNKDIDILTVMVASLKTGRAYAPIDITFPAERLLQIASTVECELLFNFTDIEIDKNFIIAGKQFIENKIYTKPYAEISKANWVKPEDNCYILFTSGSTGMPKGVQITRKNIENFVSWFSPHCNISDNKKVVLNQVSYSFDVSVIFIYIYLVQGKTLFCVDKNTVENMSFLFESLKTSGIASWISTSAFLEICAFDSNFNQKLLPKLEKVILAGEVLTKNLVSGIWSKFPEVSVVNGYGPTEGTVLLSACEITKAMMNDEKALPIGYILPNSEHHILDENGNDVPSNKTGELVVISDSISDGYYNDSVQTGKAFFKTSGGKMGYKTGDLVFEENNLLYYVARKDFQIKLNGYRIELDDISANLNKIDFISSSVVLPVYKSEKISHLIAFVILNRKFEESNIKISANIKNELKKLVPSYMVPKKIVLLDKFPLNTNGKIDRKKLMEGM